MSTGRLLCHMLKKTWCLTSVCTALIDIVRNHGRLLFPDGENPQRTSRETMHGLEGTGLEVHDHVIQPQACHTPALYVREKSNILPLSWFVPISAPSRGCSFCWLGLFLPTWSHFPD